MSTENETLADDEVLSDLDILAEIVMKLVIYPGEVWVEEFKGPGETTTTFLVHVNPQDKGRVLGNQWANMKALRHLMAIFGARQNRRIFVDLAGARPSPSPSPSPGPNTSVKSDRVC